MLTYRACESVLPLEVQQLVICIPRDRDLSKCIQQHLKSSVTLFIERLLNTHEDLGSKKKNYLQFQSCGPGKSVPTCPLRVSGVTMNLPPLVSFNCSLPALKLTSGDVLTAACPGKPLIVLVR
jgi:hypothetical protein